MGKVEVRVPQNDGEISIVHDGDLDNPTVHKVKDGKVSIDDTEAARFLADVNGAELVGGERAASKLSDATPA